MITIRKSADRGTFDHGWLKTAHTFSFGRYVDRDHMGFRALRVINDDVVAPGEGFDRHPHDNMEIITYVLSGTLAHADSLGNRRDLRPGELQHMSAGTGIEHSEFNASATEPVHLLQIWIHPDLRGHAPRYGQVTLGDRRNQWRLIASPSGGPDVAPLYQDARVYATVLDAGRELTFNLPAGRHAWVQVARGEIDLNAIPLGQGDGAAIADEGSLAIRARSDAELLLFDLA